MEGLAAPAVVTVGAAAVVEGEDELAVGGFGGVPDEGGAAEGVAAEDPA